ANVKGLAAPHSGTTCTDQPAASTKPPYRRLLMFLLKAANVVRAKIGIGRQTLAGHMETLRRVFKAFQYRDFRLMWFGACMSSIGTWMQIVAQGWLIYRLSHSAFLLALDQFLA